MSRPGLALIVAIPLMAAGSLTAHELSYWLVAPDLSTREELLAATGHGYLEYAPLALAILSLLGVLGLVGRVVASLRGGSRHAPSPWMFFLLPPLGFALQEHLERLLHSGELPLAASIEPTFILGLALQLPFALAALALARLLLVAAERLGVALAQKLPSRRRLWQKPPVAWIDQHLPRLAPVALGYTERGPPLLAR
jgi:hypothetical protein